MSGSLASPLALGLDLGSSGLRICLVEPGGTRLAEESSPYSTRLEDPWSWVDGLELLCTRLPATLRNRVGAIAIAGTSGTLLLCRPDGQPGPGGLALAYHHCCAEQAEAAAAIAAGGPAASASGSLARALHLLAEAKQSGIAGPWLLRHQADWLMGWLLGDWRWGEEGNNIRLGWDLQRQCWNGAVSRQTWSSALPRICSSGQLLGALAPAAAAVLGLPPSARVVAGSTDANAGVLAAEPRCGDGITVLGTTLVIKQFSPRPIEGAGISCHRVAGRWLVGGASNAGAGILRRFFSDRQIGELSRQIDPRNPTGLQLRPLPARGERFPVDDPNLEPVLEPRPISDGRYLQALLEGLTAIEQQGWQRLRQAGAPPLERVITLGGGARNPQWRQLRHQRLKLPVLNRPGLTAALGMARLAATTLPPP